MFLKLASLGVVCALVSAVPAGAVARETTNVNFTRSVVAAGQVLAAGQYSLERVDANLVAVTKDGRFVALLKGNPVLRGDQGPTLVTLRNGSELDRWFVGGARTGFQFANAAALTHMSKPCSAATPR